MGKPSGGEAMESPQQEQAEGQTMQQILALVQKISDQLDSLVAEAQQEESQGQTQAGPPPPPQ